MIIILKNHYTRTRFSFIFWKSLLDTRIAKFWALTFVQRPFLSVANTKTLIHAFNTSRIDCYNSLLYGLPASHLHKLQRVLNAAARLICSAPRHCHITPSFLDLHWLPIKEWIHFKVIHFTFKAIHGIAPPYIRYLVFVKQQGRYSLRSSAGILLASP